MANTGVDGTMPLAWQADFGKAHQINIIEPSFSIKCNSHDK